MFATTSQPQGFVQHGQGGGGVVGGGGMQIPASFGLGVGLQQQQQQQQPLQAQHFAQPNAASTAFATLNNPFLGMVQTDPTTNNVSHSLKIKSSSWTKLLTLLKCCKICPFLEYKDYSCYVLDNILVVQFELEYIFVE